MLSRIICLSLGLMLTSMFNVSFGQEEFELQPRTDPYPSFVLYILLFMVGLISAAKAIKPSVFTSLSTAVFSNGSLTQSMQDGFSPLNSGGLLLLLNYFLALLTCTYLTIDYYNEVLTHLYLPFSYFFFILFSFFLVSFIIGNFKVFAESIQNHFFFHQFLGLLLLPLLFLWILNFSYTPYFVIIFIFLLFVTQLYRWFRGGVFALYHGVRWYYFILYFCTLEFIPIVSIIRYLSFR
jgi:hypothetical protein